MSWCISITFPFLFLGGASMLVWNNLGACKVSCSPFWVLQTWMGLLSFSDCMFPYLIFCLLYPWAVSDSDMVSSVYHSSWLVGILIMSIWTLFFSEDGILKWMCDFEPFIYILINVLVNVSPFCLWRISWTLYVLILLTFEQYGLKDFFFLNLL